MKKQIIFITLVVLVAFSCKSINENRVKKDIIGINEQLYQLETNQIKSEEKINKLSKRFVESNKVSLKDSDMNIREIYSKGYKQFLEENYTQAILTLKKIITKYSNDKIVDNSLFWLAESYLKLNRLNEAVNYYKIIYRYFPFSEKADYALFKIGYIYFEQKKYDKANLAFHKILNEYQDSAFKKSSINYRKKIKKYRSRK